MTEDFIHMYSTPGPGDTEPDRPESAPRWFLMAVLVTFLLMLIWITVTFGGARALLAATVA